MSDARKELLKNARPSGILCVHWDLLFTFLFTPRTVQRTVTLRLLCMGKQKGNSWTILGLTARKRWSEFLNWVGSESARLNEELTVTYLNF